MPQDESKIIERIFKSTMAGAFCGIALVTAVIGFDFLSIGRLLISTPDQILLASLFVGGSAVKGVVLGFAFSDISAGGNIRKPQTINPPLTTLKSATA